MRQVMESDVARLSLTHESSLARSCAGVGAFGAGVSVSGSAAPCVAALPADRALTYARVAANGCGEVASACNSGSLDTVNLLRVQHSVSYNLQGVVAPNSRRKVGQSCTVGNRYAEQTVVLSPAPAAGTYRRSAGTVHAQRQVPRKRLARSSGVGVDPDPGPGGRCGLVGGVSGLAAACLEIPCLLVVQSKAHFLAVAEHRLIPARARNVSTQLRKARRSSVWAPSCQDVTPGGHAGVGVVSLHGAHLSLPTLFDPSFKEFFRVGRAMRVVLSLGNGGIFHLFVFYGYQGAGSDPAEARMCCAGQPVILAGDFNADPTVIPLWLRVLWTVTGLILSRPFATG